MAYFTPKSPMHISVSYCTLAYVMVYDGYLVSEPVYKGLDGMYSHPRTQCTLVFLTAH